MLHTYLLPTSKFNVSKIHTSYDLKHTSRFATSRLLVMELAKITNLMEYHILTKHVHIHKFGTSWGQFIDTTNIHIGNAKKCSSNQDFGHLIIWIQLSMLYCWAN
jgi:hypothetical protein